MLIRSAEASDLDWIASHDSHISAGILAHSISQGQVFLAEELGETLGWLRYNLFWDNTPFLNMLYVLEGHRGRGIGAALMAHWEQAMRDRNHKRILTSTAANEFAQHFYHRLGYATIGGFLIPGDAFETILVKEF